jgi:hypothetical protein
MRIYDILFEAPKGEIPEKNDDDVRVGKKTRLARDSVDDQIDSIIIKYESESIRENDEEAAINESFHKMNLKYLLHEQPLDPAADELATTGSEMVDEEQPADDEIPQLDIDTFGSKVARLIMNYKNLLKVETAIVNRAVKFIEENYDKEHAERLYAILEEQYDIQIESDFADEEDGSLPLGLGAYDGGATGG